MTAPATHAVVRFTVRGMAETAHAPTGHPYTVVYDGFCKVCNRLVTVLRKWDGGKLLEIVSSQTPGVQARFPWIPARAYTESVQVIGPGGRTKGMLNTQDMRRPFGSTRSSCSIAAAPCQVRPPGPITCTDSV